MRELHIERRKLLQTIGAATAAGIAGCVGDDDDTDEELGERVPTYEVGYASNREYTPELENTLEVLVSNCEELGLDVNLTPKEQSTQVSEVIENDFDIDAVVHAYTYSPHRINLSDLFDSFVLANEAGNRSGFNANQWVNCEATDLWHKGNASGSIEQAQEHWNELFDLIGEDIVAFPLYPLVISGAWDNEIDLGPMGDGGITEANIPLLTHTTPPAGEDRYVVGVTEETVDPPGRNFTFSVHPPTIQIWSRLIHTTLLGFDENNELTTDLAESFEITDETHYYFEIPENVTFHNGDPMTAEDVLWSIEFMLDTADESSHRDHVEIVSSEVIDDTTFEFEIESPNLNFTMRELTFWGIVHPETWQEAYEIDGGPSEFAFESGDMPGSGPFEITSHTPAEELVLDAHDGHPTEVDHGIVLRVFRDEESLLSGLETGDVHLAPTLSPAGFRRAIDMDGVNGEMKPTFTTSVFNWQMSHGPTKFKEFRHAIGKAYDRREVNELVFDGESTEVFTPTMGIAPNLHPMAPDDVWTFTDDPSGDIDGARELLEEEGWGWDDDGNLHYPVDADLDPLWPEGEGPDADEYDCFNDEGEYIPIDER